MHTFPYCFHNLKNSSRPTWPALAEDRITAARFWQRLQRNFGKCMRPLV